MAKVELKIPEHYDNTISVLRKTQSDVSPIVDDVRCNLLAECRVSNGEMLAVIDYLLEIREEMSNSIYGLRSALESSAIATGECPKNCERKKEGSPSKQTARKLVMDAENAVFEALLLHGNPFEKDTETWLTAASVMLRRATESI